jgi:hypothetical protein
MQYITSSAIWGISSKRYWLVKVNLLEGRLLNRTGLLLNSWLLNGTGLLLDCWLLNRTWLLLDSWLLLLECGQLSRRRLRLVLLLRVLFGWLGWLLSWLWL